MQLQTSNIVLAVNPQLSDGVFPLVVIDGVAVSEIGTVNITITFSSPVSGFDSSKLKTTGGMNFTVASTRVISSVQVDLTIVLTGGPGFYAFTLAIGAARSIARSEPTLETPISALYAYAVHEPPHNIVFVDEDGDEGVLTGDIVVGPSPTDYIASVYRVYWSNSPNSTVESHALFNLENNLGVISARLHRVLVGAATHFVARPVYIDPTDINNEVIGPGVALRIEDRLRPRITLQPLSQRIMHGSSLTLECDAIAVPPPTWSWTKDGVVILGATSSPLPLQQSILTTRQSTDA